MKTKEEFQHAWQEDLLEQVDNKTDNGWRHGTNNTTVFELFTYREEFDDWNTTNTFWQATYRVSGDSEYHGIREGDFTFHQVWPQEVVVKKVQWLTKEPVDTAN